MSAPIEMDPVCGMTVDPANLKWSSSNDGRIYYFCSEKCLAEFKSERSRCIAKVSEAHDCPVPRAEDEKPAGASETGEYTCPMHPQIVRQAPGNCPICGMALEPRTPTAAEDSRDLVGMTRRFWVSAALTAVVVLTGMAHLVSPKLMEELLSPRALSWTELVLASPVVLWGGWPFFERGWQSLVNQNLNMFTLIGLGVGVAYVFSVIAATVPQIFPASFRGA